MTIYGGGKFVEFYKKYEISHHLILMFHPQMNGEVEVTNRTLLQGLNKRLGKAKGSLVDELYHMFWAYRMTPSVPMKETPFSLAFRTKTMIPIELEVPPAWVKNFDE